MTTNPYGMARFENKVALVTGGAAGIGRATATRLAREGAQVIIVDKNEEMGQQAVAQIEAEGGAAHFCPADLADDASIHNVGAWAAARFPALHCVVNNAAIVRRGHIEDGSWQANWEIETQVGLRGWILLTQVLLPHLKQEGGAIVNISSEAGFLGRANQLVYDLVKTALISVTRSMACEFVEYGIRVNGVAPGWTLTEMHFADHADPAARKKELENTRASCLMQRLGGPEEIAAAITFLLSADASYITGTMLHVDGGRVGMRVA